MLNLPQFYSSTVESANKERLQESFVRQYGFGRR